MDDAAAGCGPTCNRELDSWDDVTCCPSKNVTMSKKKKKDLKKKKKKKTYCLLSAPVRVCYHVCAVAKEPILLFFSMDCTIIHCVCRC